MAQQTAQQPTKSQTMGKRSSAYEDLAKEGAEMQEDFQKLCDQVGSAMSDYYRKRPGAAAMMLFAVGFYVGWKVKPW